ncbi:MAG: ABC transporter permease [Chloroflexi bacterium]|nr:ABC transporter permease [Chloroflexota bacterium]
MTVREAAIETRPDLVDAGIAVRRLTRRDVLIGLVNRFWPGVFGFAVFFGVWEGVVRITDTPAFIIPTPSFVLAAFFPRLPGLLAELVYTLAAASIGLVIGLAIGIIGAVLMVHWRILERGLFPIAVLIKLVPFVALAPLLIVWIGYDLKPKIFLAALITYFPVLVNMITGLRSVDEQALEFFRTVGSSRWEILWRLRWQASLPYLMACLKVVGHLAIVGATVGEYFGSKNGIGMVIARTSEMLQIQGLFSAALLMALLGSALVILTNTWERRVVYWHESVRTSGGRG